MNDETVIPYLALALNASASLPKILTRDELNNIKYRLAKRDIYSEAALTLVKFDNYGATQALENAINSQNDTVRHKVAEILSGSKIPRALEILLKVRNQKDDWLRVKVISALETINT